MKQLYQIDLEQTQYVKLITNLLNIDLMITMGCNVSCPWLPCFIIEDWV